MSVRDGGSRDFDVVRVAPGAWAAIARDGGFALCNAGIFDLGGRTVVFDTMLTPRAGARLARVARRLTGRLPDLAVNSHWHGDHIRGNVSFAPAQLASTTRTRELIRTAGVAQWASDVRTMPKALRDLDSPGTDVPARERALYRGWFQGTLAVPRPFRPCPPDLTFEKELLVHGRRRDLRLLTFGGGHSPSDVFALLPEERVVCFGDLLSVGLHPSVGDGDPVRWAAILRRIRRLGVEYAIPGHGRVGGIEEIRVLERYLLRLDRLARAARRRAQPVGELVRSEPPEECRAWRFSAFYGENLARAYSLRRN